MSLLLNVAQLAERQDDERLVVVDCRLRTAAARHRIEAAGVVGCARSKSRAGFFDPHLIRATGVLHDRMPAGFARAPWLMG